MEIINNKYNSLPEQVEENMKNIKLLAEYLKEAYRTNNKAEISQDSISIAISLTNAPEDTTNGWLLDGRGNLFKITGGDGYALLLDFYSDIRGVKGEDGATLQIDDDNTSLIKVWSSLKTNSEIEKAKDKGIYYTNVEPTIVGGVLRVTLSDILNISNDIPIKYKDLIIYTDGTNAKALYIVKSTGTIVINAQVEKICDFAVSGKSTNIYISSSQASYDSGTYSFLIPITDIRKLDGSSFSVDDFDENADNLIYYIDMSSMNPQDVKLKAIYSFRGLDTISTPNNAICNIEMLTGGDKLYHNIVSINNLAWTSGDYRQLNVTLDLYLPFKFTDVNSFVSWIDNLTEDTPVFGIGQGWSAGWTTIITKLKPSGQANRVKFDMVSFNHTSFVISPDNLTTNNLSSQQIVISN